MSRPRRQTLVVVALSRPSKLSLAASIQVGAPRTCGPGPCAEGGGRWRVGRWIELVMMRCWTSKSRWAVEDVVGGVVLYKCPWLQLITIDPEEKDSSWFSFHFRVQKKGLVAAFSSSGACIEVLTHHSMPKKCICFPLIDTSWNWGE